MCRVRFARKSGVSICNFSAVCTSGNFENDGMCTGDLNLPKVPAKLTVDLTNEGDRAHYFRGKIENGTFAPVGRQESHALFGLSQSNALLRVAVGEALDRKSTRL